MCIGITDRVGQSLPAGGCACGGMRRKAVDLNLSAFRAGADGATPSTYLCRRYAAEVDALRDSNRIKEFFPHEEARCPDPGAADGGARTSARDGGGDPHDQTGVLSIMNLREYCHGIIRCLESLPLRAPR